MVASILVQIRRLLLARRGGGRIWSAFTALRHGPTYLPLELMRRTIVEGTVVLRPANIAGDFEIGATSHIAQRILSTGCYEPDVTNALRKIRLGHGIIVNVGANVGLFAVHLANSFGAPRQVLALEPNGEAFSLLKRNVDRNNLSGMITPLQVCVGESKGRVEFSYVAGKPEYSSIGQIGHRAVANEEKATMPVEVAPLNSLVGNSRVALLFMDVEGAEALVLRGADDILKKSRPILFFECSDVLLRQFGASSRIVENYLMDFGYKVMNGTHWKSRLNHPFEGEAIALPLN